MTKYTDSEHWDLQTHKYKNTLKTNDNKEKYNMIVITAVILTFHSVKSTDGFNKINKVIWGYNSTTMAFVP